MSYNAVLMELVSDGPHHMSPFMVLIHDMVRQQIRNSGDLLAVELGTSHGNSTIAIATALLAEGKGILHTCDLVPSQMAHNLVYRSGCAESVVFHKTDSVQLASQFNDDSVGVLLIDTSHERQQTEKELGVWCSKVKRGGLVFLHDTCTCPEGVSDPAIKFAEFNKWPYYNIAVDCGLGVMTKP